MLPATSRAGSPWPVTLLFAYIRDCLLDCDGLRIRPLIIRAKIFAGSTSREPVFGIRAYGKARCTRLARRTDGVIPSVGVQQPRRLSAIAGHTSRLNCHSTQCPTPRYSLQGRYMHSMNWPDHTKPL